MRGSMLITLSHVSQLVVYLRLHIGVSVWIDLSVFAFDISSALFVFSILM